MVSLRWDCNEKTDCSADALAQPHSLPKAEVLANPLSGKHDGGTPGISPLSDASVSDFALQSIDHTAVFILLQRFTRALTIAAVSFDN